MDFGKVGSWKEVGRVGAGALLVGSTLVGTGKAGMDYLVGQRDDQMLSVHEGRQAAAAIQAECVSKVAATCADGGDTDCQAKELLKCHK